MSEAHHDSDSQYIKIWAILVGLLVVSVVGPMFEIQVVTLITAFGIAVVKAYMVVKHFMHLPLEPKFVSYIMATVVVFMFLFFAGTAPDVMKAEGENWVKPQWQAAAAAHAAEGPSAVHH